MRWVVILFIALGLSALAIYKNQERPATRDIVATTAPETLVLYQDALLGFSVTYQQQDQMRTENFDGFLQLTAPIVGFQLPVELFAGTNLVEAGVYIGASSSPALNITCTKPLKAADEISMGTTTVNGQIWNVFTSTGAAAGNFYESKSYRTVHGGTCFEMVQLLHSGNIGNYPEGTVAEFDKAKFEAMLGSIADTFTFVK